MIRELLEEDLLEVVRLEKELFGDHWDHDDFKKELDSDLSHMYVLTIDGKIVGYIAITILYERVEITDLAVAKDKQRQGYAKLLLDHVTKVAKDHGCEVMSLEVKVTNIPALRLYEGYDFIVMRKRERYYKDGTDAYEMARGI